MEESNVSKNTKNNQKLTWKNLGCNHPFPTLVCFSTKTIPKNPSSPALFLMYIYQPQKNPNLFQKKNPSLLFFHFFLFCNPLFFYVFVSASQKLNFLKEIHFHFFYFPSFSKIKMFLPFYVGSLLSICM